MSSEKHQDHHHHHQHHTHVAVNIFDDLKKRNSNLLSLFEDTEILNIAAQAPAPSKDYCQLILTFHRVIYRCWKITLRGDADTKFPKEIRDSYEEFGNDEYVQREIARVFGKHTLTYIRNIVEKGKVDFLNRLPENILVRVISFLNLEDIARLAQVNTVFRKLCKSDKVWMGLYKKYYSSEIKSDLMMLAERDGWRKLFFTNKIKLQLELRRQSKMQRNDSKSKLKSSSRSSLRHYDENDDLDDIDTENANQKNSSPQHSTRSNLRSQGRLRHSTFLTED